jgi:hypothetical protein
MLPLMFVIICSLFEWKWMCTGFFIVWLYMPFRLISSCQDRVVEIQLIDWIPSGPVFQHCRTWCFCDRWVEVRGECSITQYNQRKTTAKEAMEKLNKQETKMWWLSIPPIWTKRTFTSHLNSPITKTPRPTMLKYWSWWDSVD